MKIVALAIREFALPVPRTGSIESHSGYGRSTEEGLEIHQLIQRKRSEEDPAYRSEIRLSHEFERGGYRFRIGGRMDGLFERTPPRIEEIKTTFNTWDLFRKLSDNPDHPYCLQLATYGYFYRLQNQVTPELFFHLVSTRNRDSQDLQLEFDFNRYEEWLDRRLDELTSEARKCEKRALRRRKVSENFHFPFPSPRPGQVELIAAIEENMKAGKRMLIQAPTGLGKTAGVLFPALKEALSRGQRVIYVTPKNSQHSVAEDAIGRFQENGSKIKSLTVTAKGKICFKNEPLCDPDYCEFARDYYTKLHSHGLLDLLSKKRKLTARTFRKFGEDYEVCPFELQMDAIRDVDTVMCDYNYVFAPRSALARTGDLELDQVGKPNLVIDEAHNLPSRAMDYYSPALSSVTLEKMREELHALPQRIRDEAGGLLDDCIQTLIDCRPDGAGRSMKIDPPVAPLLEQDAKLRDFLSRYLRSDIEIRPRDVVLRLSFYWSEFTGALGFVQDSARQEFFTTFHPHPTGGSIKITCCDASTMLKACYDGYEQVVGFSATLKPFDYYAKLSGLAPESLATAEFQSPFPRNNRKLLIIPQISSKFSERERNYPRIADAIRKIVALRPGNYFAFFPSFAFLERVYGIFQAPPDFSVLRQERDLRPPAIERILDHLRQESGPTVLFAVQGGVFSEGVDYPGNMIIGAFVVGPPLPNFDLEREQMREYYERQYGAGFDYAYAFPAMSKAVQAAGRVIRSETDRGLVVLMDNRFIHPSYTKSMPRDWFDDNAKELVSTSILSEISAFWNE